MTNQRTLEPKKKEKGKIGKEPPKKKTAFNKLIKIMLAYSPIKKRAKPALEYSTKYPATSSASASGKSKGGRLVSAKEEIKNINKRGKKGNTNQTYC